MESLLAGTMEKKLSTDAMQSLVSYEWPGNIRELENLIRYLIVTAQDDYIERADIPLHVRDQNPDIDPFGGAVQTSKKDSNDFISIIGNMTWPQLEKEYVISLLKKNNWNITWAAKASGINRSTFASRMRKLEIKRYQEEFD